MPIFTDLIGKRFGKLIVIEYKYTNEHKYYLCKCDCGNETVVASNKLTGNKTKSCGCLKKKHDYGVASFNVLFSEYKKNAIKRQIVFDLTTEQFKTLVIQNCYYCGISPKQIISRKVYNGNFIHNGIDRIDSTKGYEIGNVVPCCGRCNEGKMDLSQDEFLSWIERVYKHSILGEL